MKKVIIIGGVALVASAAAWYLYSKKKQKKAIQQSQNPTSTTTNLSTDNPVSEPAVDHEKETFDQLSSIIQADPVFKSKPFPDNFFDSVNMQMDDYNAGKPGRFNTADVYKGFGKVGAFMAVSDAWQSAMGYSNDTHDKLWEVFNNYRAK